MKEGTQSIGSEEGVLESFLWEGGKEVSLLLEAGKADKDSTGNSSKRRNLTDLGSIEQCTADDHQRIKCLIPKGKVILMSLFVTQVILFLNCLSDSSSLGSHRQILTAFSLEKCLSCFTCKNFSILRQRWWPNGIDKRWRAEEWIGRWEPKLSRHRCPVALETPRFSASQTCRWSKESS